ncbi:TPA: hypothetical protein N0F65_012696 [Lagenidium giganteum]|uniref:Protein kinase domain-containing protein n=1 Tax=Lagenidium giganteum TaxID=4803 RepID=A0AAV2YF94_9STRA|nr:TPA: hypothetical protein N0F65_012696 [Lagenidium giganteum]
MRQFETRTVRLRTGAEPTILVFANEELVYETPLPLDARCQRKGHTGLKLSGKKDHLKLRIRFVTPADVAIWTRVFHQAITHAKWIRGLGPTTCLAHDRMSTVLVATHHPLQEEVAIKVLPRARVDDGSCNEVQILKKLYHAQALQFLLSYHVIETPSDVRVIMPRFDGRNLLVFLQERPAPHALDEREAAALLWSMCEGLQALHAQGIIHCDVKLENILLTDATSARLIDFGGAYDVSPWGKDLVGTPGYVAPERILTTAPPTPAADVFSLGVVLFQVLTGRHPFRAKTLSLEDSLSLDWAHAQTQLQARGVSSQAQDLLQLMLKACPSSRIPLSAISSHPWMTSASNEVR